MIDHISYAVSDYRKARAFYDAALAPLGIAMQMEFGTTAGYGPPNDPQFWISDEGNPTEQVGKSRGFHIAFKATSRTAVDALHAAAIKAGAKDNGKPGLRPNYHPNYYGAFVIDPDGYRLEAVCHHP